MSCPYFERIVDARKAVIKSNLFVRNDRWQRLLELEAVTKHVAMPDNRPRRHSSARKLELQLDALSRGQLDRHDRRHAEFADLLTPPRNQRVFCTNRDLDLELNSSMTASFRNEAYLLHGPNRSSLATNRFHSPAKKQRMGEGQLPCRTGLGARHYTTDGWLRSHQIPSVPIL